MEFTIIFSCLGEVKAFLIILPSNLSRSLFLTGLISRGFVCEPSGCGIDSQCSYLMSGIASVLSKELGDDPI